MPPASPEGSRPLWRKHSNATFKAPGKRPTENSILGCGHEMELVTTQSTVVSIEFAFEWMISISSWDSCFHFLCFFSLFIPPLPRPSCCPGCSDVPFNRIFEFSIQIDLMTKASIPPSSHNLQWLPLAKCFSWLSPFSLYVVEEGYTYIWRRECKWSFLWLLRCLCNCLTVIDSYFLKSKNLFTTI